MKSSYLILTDSGGIQEEAPSLNKPVLVMREVTERREGVRAGCSRLVGLAPDSIVRHVDKLLGDKKLYNKMASSRNPYGDGKAAQRIAGVLAKVKT
jgi:UDP-N-acetylglucosamine 2-epimerase (non-hydrolysing)